MKHFVMALSKEVSIYVCNSSRGLFEEKVNDGVFVRRDIRKLTKNEYFELNVERNE